MTNDNKKTNVARSSRTKWSHWLLYCFAVIAIATGVAGIWSSFFPPSASAAPTVQMTDILPNCTAANTGYDVRPDCDFSTGAKSKQPALCFMVGSLAFTVDRIDTCQDIIKDKDTLTVTSLMLVASGAATAKDGSCYTVNLLQSKVTKLPTCNQTKCNLGPNIVCAATEPCMGTDLINGIVGNALYGEVQNCPAIQVGNDNIIWYDSNLAGDDGLIHPTIYRAQENPAQFDHDFYTGKSSTQTFYDAGPTGGGPRYTCLNPVGTSGAPQGTYDGNSTGADQSPNLNTIQVHWGSGGRTRDGTAVISGAYYSVNDKAPNPPAADAVSCSNSMQTGAAVGGFSRIVANVSLRAYDPDSPLFFASGDTASGGSPTTGGSDKHTIYDNIIGPDNSTTGSQTIFKLDQNGTTNLKAHSYCASNSICGSYDLFTDGNADKACQSVIAVNLAGVPYQQQPSYTQSKQNYTGNVYIFPMAKAGDFSTDWDALVRSETYAGLVSKDNGSDFASATNCKMASPALYNKYAVATVATQLHGQDNTATIGTSDGALNNFSYCYASGYGYGNPSSFYAAAVNDVPGALFLTAFGGNQPGGLPHGYDKEFCNINLIVPSASFYTGVGNSSCSAGNGHACVNLQVLRTGSTNGSNHSNGKNTPVIYDAPAVNPYFQYHLIGGDDGYKLDEKNPVSDTNHSTLPYWPVPPVHSNIASAAAASPGVALKGDGSTGSDTTPVIDCHVTFFNPLSWFLCPLASGLESIAIGLDNSINGALSYDTSQLNNYAKPFNNIRDLSLGLIGLGALVAIVSQAAGMEIFDAYTIRKVLPRLFICTIGISLSWPLMKFFIGFINDVGVGVQQIIYLGANNGPHVNKDLLSGSGQSVVGLLSIGPITDLGFVGLLSFAATAALAAAVAYLVLIIRQMVITVLVIFAPIAIAAYLLPNTGKAWKLWWESFSKALLMFPMISGLIAIGRVFSSYSSDSLIGFVAFFAPYFLIPLTFRFAGGLLGTLGGFVNDRGKGMFDGLKQGRSERMKHNKAERNAGQRFEGKSWIPGSIKAANAMNEVTKGLGTGIRGRFGLGRRGAIARGYVDQHAAQEAQKDPSMQAISGWNDVNRILAEGMGDEVKGHKALVEHLMRGGDQGDWKGTREQAEAQADRALRAAKAAGGFTKARGVAAYYNMARDGTAIRDTDDLTRLAATAGQGDRNNTFKFAAEGASISRQVGRSDLAAASDPIGALAFAQSDLIFRPGQREGLYSNPDDPKGPKNAAADLERLQYDAWASGAGGEVAYTKFGTAKSRTIKNDTNGAFNVLKSHLKNLDDIRAGVIDQNTGQVVARKYKDSEVQNAASMIIESQQAIQNGYGKLDNRTAAANIIDNAENQTILKTVLDMPANIERPLEQVGSYTADGVGIYATSADSDKSRVITMREAAGKLAGDRYAALTDAQREELQRQGANRATEDEANKATP